MDPVFRVSLALLLLLLRTGEAAETDPWACDCMLETELQFVNLRSRVREHSVPDRFAIDISSLPCDPSCVVFDKLPDTPDRVHQGNWSIDRDGVIRFDHRLHKTGVARLNITVEEQSSSSNYTAHSAYFIIIDEDPDYPLVFASQAGVALELTEFDSIRDQHRNLSLRVEQNTGNNTAYADLLFTAGVFDFDANEAIRVELPDDARPRLGQLVGSLNDSVSTAIPEVPNDCELTAPERLAERNLTEWDVEVTRWHACNLSLPYPAPELSWLSHLARYRPGLRQRGVDRFVLAYTDKYGLESRLHIRVHILQNPCVNGGVCRGPAWDPQCVSEVRSEGFFDRGYLCSCPTGWVGDRCEIDFDDCSSSPCPSPFVCVDKFRGYDCVCPENLANCQPLLPAWQLAAILLGLAACVSCVAAVLVLASQRAPVVLPLGKSSPTTPKPAAAPEPEATEDTVNDEASQADAESSRPPSRTEESPPVVTFQQDSPTPAPPTPEPEPTRTPALLRPPNPEPQLESVDENRRRSFHRGSIFVTRRPQEGWRTGSRRPSAAVPFIEEEPQEQPVGGRVGGRAGGIELDGAESPSDAWRLRRLREDLLNQQVLQEF